MKENHDMKYESITNLEQENRQLLVRRTREMISRFLPVQDQDETSIMVTLDEFYLQILFSDIHPLMVLYLARAIDRSVTAKDFRLINDLNLQSVLGGHALNTDIGCYTYRSTHWLNGELSQQRMMEMLDRCVEDAKRGYYRVNPREKERYL